MEQFFFQLTECPELIVPTVAWIHDNMDIQKKGARRQFPYHIDSPWLSQTHVNI